jgi:hypothetical protein
VNETDDDADCKYDENGEEQVGDGPPNDARSSDEMYDDDDEIPFEVLKAEVKFEATKRLIVVTDRFALLGSEDSQPQAHHWPSFDPSF